MPLACRIFGHRFRFVADGEVMRWSCARGCGASGEKRYENGHDAAKFAAAFDREDRDDLGRRPTLATLPLWLARRLRRGRRARPGTVPARAERDGKGGGRGATGV